MGGTVPLRIDRGARRVIEKLPGPESLSDKAPRRTDENDKLREIVMRVEEYCGDESLLG